MQFKKNFFYRSSYTRWSIVFFILSFIFSTTAHARVVWEAGLDYISLVDLESGQPLNDHPVSLNATDVYTLLSSIRFRANQSGNFLTGWLDDADNETFSDHFFNESELRKLAPAISRALAMAKPSQDVIFSVTGRHAAALGSRSLTSTGRIFFKDGAFNFILGEAYVDIEKRYRRAGLPSDVPSKVDMRELKAFKLKSGTRSDTITKSIELTPYNAIERVNTRTDWVRIDQDALTDMTVQRIDPTTQETSSHDRTDALEAKVNQIEERLDHKMTHTGSEGSARSIEQRLAHLKALYEKGYITEEAYNVKMEKILSDL